MTSENLTWDSLVEIIGSKAAIELAEQVGGIPLYIPKQARHGQKIVKMIGMAAAQTLSEQWGGNRIEVPMAKAARRADILTAVVEGRLNKIQAARMLGLSLRHVRALVNSRLDTRQGSLF